MNGQRVKPSKELEPEDQLEIRQGWDEKTIIVKAVSAQRKAAPEAQLLYEETAESIATRETQVKQRKAAAKQVA